MKPDKTAALIFTAVNVILVIVCIIFYLGTDRKSPEFKFQVSSLTWNENMEQTRLFENITAYDKKDGEVTDRIVIEKIVENKAESAVTVFYAVSDREGNVTKISRVFPAVYKADKMTDRLQDTVLEQDSVSDNQVRADEVSKNAEIVNTVDVNPDSGNEEKEEETSENPDSGNEEIEEAASENTASANEESEHNENEDSKGEKPVITLKKPEVTTSIGTAPAWVEVIGALKDDKDGYEDLFYNLSVSKYDVNKAGTYKVALSTKDSDGNTSEPVTLTVHVK